MRLLMNGVLAAVLLAAAPVWAHDGHDQWKREYRHHFYPKHHVHRPYWAPPGHVKHHHHYYSNYYAPAPAASVAPGIHVIFPDVYIPWPR